MHKQDLIETSGSAHAGVLQRRARQRRGDAAAGAVLNQTEMNGSSGV